MDKLKVGFLYALLQSHRHLDCQQHFNECLFSNFFLCLHLFLLLLVQNTDKSNEYIDFGLSLSHTLYLCAVQCFPLRLFYLVVALNGLKGLLYVWGDFFWRTLS